MSLAGPASASPRVAAAWLLRNVEAKFGEGLTSARAPGARGPGASAESLRVAYLDLLKLSLCDLAGTRTTSVTRTLDGDVMSRELEGEQLRSRAAGMDWPLHGLTMIGLDRLDDLQACVEQVATDGIDGDLIEAGTWRGGASMLMRATLDSLGEDGRTVFVADSFQGFPPVDRKAPDDYDLGVDLAAFDYLAIPVEEVKDNFSRFGLLHGVTFIPGFFEDTLHSLGDHRWSIVRLDGDTYDATRTSLEALYPTLSAGGFLIVDDYLQIDPCRAAVDEFRREHGITEPLEHVDWNCARWRRGTEPTRMQGARGRSSPLPSAPRALARRPQCRIPSIEELEARHELAELRSRLSATEAEVKRLTSSPLAGPRVWMRRALGQALRGRA
jgi:O-methyltransferase